MSTEKLLLFRKWDLSEIEIKDPGLKNAISLKEAVFPMDYGRSALKRFNKADVNIVERLVNKMMHFGKKHAKNTGRMAGKKIHVYNIVKTAFEIINLQTTKKPSRNFSSCNRELCTKRRYYTYCLWWNCIPCLS